MLSSLIMITGKQFKDIFKSGIFKIGLQNYFGIERLQRLNIDWNGILSKVIELAE